MGHLPCPHLYASGGFGERFNYFQAETIIKSLTVGVGVFGDGVEKGGTGCGVSMAVHSDRKGRGTFSDIKGGAEVAIQAVYDVCGSTGGR